MRSPCVVECELSGNATACGRHAVVGMQINLFVFDASPETLDEDVVAPGTLAVHADVDVGVFERLGEVDGREPRSLISGLPNLRIASFSASRQGAVSGVVDNRQARTLQLDQSCTATK